jgi:chorismate--pyruvate lyase
MRDIFWKQSVIGCEALLTPWLMDHGSLTARIKRHCGKFGVLNQFEGLMCATHDETALLGVPQRQKVYTREVFLLADEKPVVFAHSVVAARHLCGAWQALQHLGNRSLGTLLFTHPQVARAPLNFRAPKPAHPLYRRAVATLAAPPGKLWARRSLFTLYGAPLLVTEVFLPDILKLKK